MLVLSRKAGQQVLIGDNIRITVTRMSGNRVLLGVDAPDHVHIVRAELESLVSSFDDDIAGPTNDRSPRRPELRPD